MIRMSQVEIVPRTETVVVGLEVVASFAELAIRVPNAWRELFSRREELPPPPDGRFAEASAELGAGRYRETVGVPLGAAPASPLPAGMALGRLPAGEYAHHRHEGPVTDIGSGFAVIYAWAAERAIALGGLKLDVGYAPGGQAGPHDLFIDVRPAG
jgi:predicted transcriptional regulator YdeE